MPDPNEVLLIGDSISIGYTPPVAELLAGAFDVTHHEGNAGDSGDLRAELDSLLAAGGEPGVIHFNVGLHDLKRKRPEGTLQVELKDFRVNLRAIVERLQATGARLIWATITPVIGKRHAAIKPFDRRQVDVEAYNAAAWEIIAAAGIAVNDLHALVEAAGAAELLCEDGVHFTDDGYRRLARAVAAAIRTGA